MGAALALTVPSATTPAVAGAAPPAYPSDTAKPDLIPLLSGFDQLWRSSGKNDL